MATTFFDFEVSVTIVRKMYVRAESMSEAELAGLTSVDRTVENTDFNVVARELPSDPPTVTPDWFVCETLATDPCQAVCARTEEECAALLGIPKESLYDRVVGFHCTAGMAPSYGTEAAIRNPLQVVTQISHRERWRLPDGSDAYERQG